MARETGEDCILMARYTVAYLQFEYRIREIDVLRQLAVDKEIELGVVDGARVVRALCRSGVVLLSSHIEGYVEELVELILQNIVDKRVQKSVFEQQFFYYFSKDIIDEICETQQPEKISEKVKLMFERDGDIWGDTGIFVSELSVERFTAGFSAPRVDRIRSLVGRFGYKDFRGDLADQLQGDFHACVNMVENVVNQRNKIAHGDVHANPTPRDLEDMVKFVRLFCQVTDDVVARWFAGIDCSLVS